MAKEKITARARTQYTDYMVKEPMELMYVLAILPEVRLPGLHIQLPRGQKELPRRLTELFLPDVKLKIPG